MTVMGTAVTNGTPSADDRFGILTTTNILPAKSRPGSALQTGHQCDKGMTRTKLSELFALQINAETERLMQLAQERVSNYLKSDEHQLNLTHQAISKFISEIPKLVEVPLAVASRTTPEQRDVRHKYEGSIKIDKTSHT